MTTNLKWTEIKTNLEHGQQAHDIPESVVRVFKQNLYMLMELLKDRAFEELQAWLYSIEFKKRGLLHAHLLLWLKRKCKIPPNAITTVVSAEFPDRIIDPHLYTIVTANMIHGLCGEHNPSSVCMKNSPCSKGFPKPFLRHTEQGILNQNTEGDTQKTAVLVLFSQAIPKEENLKKWLITNG